MDMLEYKVTKIEDLPLDIFQTSADLWQIICLFLKFSLSGSDSRLLRKKLFDIIV